MPTPELIETIIESLYNGQFTQAKAQAQYRCKALPEKQSATVALVVHTLCDPLGLYRDADLALRFINLFNY